MLGWFHINNPGARGVVQLFIGRIWAPKTEATLYVVTKAQCQANFRHISSYAGLMAIF